jgi:hypothetical protein
MPVIIGSRELIAALAGRGGWRRARSGGSGCGASVCSAQPRNKIHNPPEQNVERPDAPMPRYSA